ncbi:hypothetical protein BaRGS_00005145 [Batillaria attramentaria]|uniref:CCDC144C-like coiled-coil domain-containing protein n=1 Tax=Batillaria attramentaria TaxID=370345 RepID=A0ABD0LVT7_9CAEN
MGNLLTSSEVVSLEVCSAGFFFTAQCVVRAFISESERPTIMFEYQRFLLGDLGRIVLREELKRIEEQVREEARAKEVAALIASSSATTVSGRPSQHSTSSGAQVVLHPQPSQGLPQQSNSGSYLTGPTALQIKQRLQIGSGNPHMAYHSDGMESDDSLASDNERPDNIHSYYPTLGSTQSFRPDFNMADDDILSYTSTEFENGDLVPASTGPFSRDVLLNMNLSDPSTLVQVQDYIRETKRHMEQERNQRAVLENKLRLITKEKQDMQRKLDSMSETRQALEQNKLDLEAKIRSLEYNFSEEQEKRRNAELLLTKTKEQLARKEQNFTSELEAKQRAELTMRNIQLEMRAAQNTIKELEEEREELERQLQHEHNARMLQEQINEEQSRLAQQRHQETMASAMAASRLEARPGEDGTDGEGRGERDKLNAELYAIKMEMDRQRSRFKDEITLMATENEELQSRVEELKSEIKLNEEALAHATMQYNMQLGTLRSEGSTAAAAIEKERAAREKLEAELESLQKRLLSANTEKDRAVQARNELEHDYQREKQSALRDKERKDEELAMLKDNNQHLSQRLHTLETKLNAMENELHVSNTSLMERTNQLQQLRQEADRHKQAQENFDTNIRLEKELNTKLQVKIESLQEKLSQSQHEVLSLKQQVENLRTAGLNSSSADSHEQLTAIMASLHADSDRSKAILEERSNNLMEQVQHLKEEARNADNRRNTLEADLRRLQTEHTEVRHKLSLAEAQLQMMQKAKDQLEQERGQLKLELEKATEKQHASQEKAVEAQARVAELTERLDRAERASQLSTQNLATTSASYNAVARTKDEMEDTLQRLQVENARLDSDLRHERERAEMLQAELTDSYKVRSSLEALCSNLKSTTAHLEEKLGEEAATRVVLAHEARDSKNLLDQELAARRHLGLKIVKLERAQKHAEVKVQEAKKSSSEAEGHKSVLESQLMEESQKNQQLQKEVTNLKSLLKAAKKKMKDTGVAPSPRGENGHYAEFQREVSAEGGKVSTPRGDSSNHHHYHHVVKSADFEHETRNNTLYEQTKPRAVVIDPGEVTSIQTSVKQLERCVRQLETKVSVERVQSQVDGGFVDVEGLQQDMETKYRRELNRKLEEVNAYLETQTRARDRLDSSRSENEARITADKRRLEEENSNLRLQYEQALAQRESREMEARRFKQLYESEMQWRMRLSDQLQQYADRSILLKPRFTASDRLKSRLHGSVGNLNMSAMSDASVNVSRINGDRDEALSNKIRAELDRSIAKHLEAAPHSDIVPVIRETEGALLNQSLAKSSKDYIEILKRKYCV